MSTGSSRGCRAYVGAIAALALLPLAAAAWVSVVRPPHPGWLLLAALSLLSGPLAVRIPSVSATISVSEGFIFAAGLLFGAPAAIVTAVLDGLGVSIWNRHRLLRRTLFNIAEPAVSVSVAMWLFYAMSGETPLLHRSVAVLPLIAPLVAMTVSYFVLNSVLLAAAVWLENGSSPVVLLRKHLAHLALDFCVSLSLAAVIVQTSANVTVAAIVVLVPMLLASYLSSHYVAGQLEDTDRHLAELRRLYDSTVETLAMAVDAKDQITHGHIRRVQVLSTRLAAAVGASDQEVRALEAAALLHDLGKLAVPEHILNKPGALTPAEYEQMKAHAAIGAGILSRIDFPFPVVPIVRHHHENWDGSGYPDGLSGERIPLGARILAVVDCYDALTSDRPYRRRMTADDAVEIIRRRGGQMYDPAIVEAFAAVYATVPVEDIPPHIDKHALLPLRLTSAMEDLVGSPRTTIAGKGGKALRERRQSVYELLARMPEAGARDVASAMTTFLGEALPEAAAAIYTFDEEAHRLVLQSAAARVASVAPGFVRLGSGVTGWVATNRVVMANSDAALDLGDRAQDSSPPMRLCVSAPIVYDDELGGVITVYSWCAFSEPDRLLVEIVAEELAPLFARRARGDNGSRRPAVMRGRWPVAVSQ